MTMAEVEEAVDKLMRLPTAVGYTRTMAQEEGERIGYTAMFAHPSRPVVADPDDPFHTTDEENLHTGDQKKTERFSLDHA